MVVTHTFMYNGKQLRNYTMLYDKSKKAALWSACVMHADAYPWKVTRGDNWNYDPALVFGTTANPDYSWQANLSSSYGGGYTRGHQIASNDRRTTIYQMYQTDYYSNMTPQTDELNSSNASKWDNLETAIQNLGKATTGRDTLYVVTGAIFDSGYKTDATDAKGKSCPVPTRYYKCIMKVSYNSSGAVNSATGAAFIINHETLAFEELTIKALQDITGFDYFANIPEDKQKTAEETFTTFFNTSSW